MKSLPKPPIRPAELRQAAEIATQNQRDFAAALRSGVPRSSPKSRRPPQQRRSGRQISAPPNSPGSYEQGGAAALSVLTDRDFFQGSLEDLRAARAACRLPVLRKDFTIAEYHVLESAAAGADAILLIAAILDESELRAFRQLAGEFQMAALVEAHNEPELEKSLRSGAEIVGINNRDLRTFQVSLETSIALAPKSRPGSSRSAKAEFSTRNTSAAYQEPATTRFLWVSGWCTPETRLAR